ncbi:YitT family protein [Sediminispirochaeta bajacaliforniensis]|uniref:YitT family protein n=1 Tax=Sediminispirochaeta bajacaliforniensis TaxID=148 RepID=UPI00037B2854|nr:YitT family protein [Sediminispirochaeta bajacaliforniensis]
MSIQRKIIVDYIKAGSLAILTGSIYAVAIKFRIVLLLLCMPDMQVASPEPENERLLLVLFGAILAGIGKSLAFMNRGSTGDEDIASVYVSEKLRKPVGKISIIAGSISTVYGVVLNYIKVQDPAIVVNTLYKKQWDTIAIKPKRG